MTAINTNVRKNERSWAIEMISQINFMTNKYNLVIKHAGGETTVSQSNNFRMFPDIILYDDIELKSIVQGWEIKMPDVPITDETFILDAQRKARALSLNSTIIWNFTYTKFYVLNKETDNYEEKLKWENPQIKSRDDVELYKSSWENTLQDVILSVNKYLLERDFTHISVKDIISSNAINILINTHKNLVSDYYKCCCTSDAIMKAKIDVWWNVMNNEYNLDEKDKYTAYAKSVILNWSYRIIFAHLIKKYHNGADLINDINYETNPEVAGEIFKEITSKCDFYNIFKSIDYGDLLPEQTWKSLVELSLFLKENGINFVDQVMLQKILENCIATSRRELNGQYSTPIILANILARITIHDYTKPCIDPCCGTGTIPREIIKLKHQHNSIPKEDAIKTTWASDKYRLPLQIANISMISADTINLPCFLFQKNVFSLKCGDFINIVNPRNGKYEKYKIPSFGAICTNLPFIAFEYLSSEDQELINRFMPDSGLNKKSDISYYISLYLYNILEDDGYLGIIVSNSWLGTEAGDSFYQQLTKLFILEQVHISGNGRWFANADVVTTILVLKKSNVKVTHKTHFFVWRKSLKEIENNENIQQVIINSALLGYSLDPNIIALSSYSPISINEIHNMNLSYNSLFHEISWLLKLKRYMCPLTDVFKIIRGSRRGWDKLFFPKESHNIEDIFIKPALFNAQEVNYLIAKPDREAFCCSENLTIVKQKYKGAYDWIMRFSDEVNGTGERLQTVLATGRLKWYEMLPNEVVPLFTMMNPDNRMFFGRFIEPSFINQRLIGLLPVEEPADIDLLHALLNSILMKFYIEAVGFGRGLGVLDINKNSISKCYMLNPSLLSVRQSKEIKKAFSYILKKRITTIEEELSDEDWINFNKIVLRSYDIENYYDDIVKSLLSLRAVRKTVVKITETN